MQIRIRIPSLEAAARAALERRAQLALGRYAASIDSVALLLERAVSGAAEHADCRVSVRLRDGTELHVQDDGRFPGRALLRAAWRVEQHCARGRLPGGQRAAAAAAAPNYDAGRQDP